METPENIFINGTCYKIKLKDRLTADRAAMGESCCNSCYINIDVGINEQQKQRTLLHEIIEIISIDNELKLSHNVICTLESQLFHVLKENGESLNYIFGFERREAKNES